MAWAVEDLLPVNQTSEDAFVQGLVRNIVRSIGLRGWSDGGPCDQQSIDMLYAVFPRAIDLACKLREGVGKGLRLHSYIGCNAAFGIRTACGSDGATDESYSGKLVGIETIGDELFLIFAYVALLGYAESDRVMWARAATVTQIEFYEIGLQVGEVTT